METILECRCFIDCTADVHKLTDKLLSAFPKCKVVKYAQGILKTDRSSAEACIRVVVKNTPKDKYAWQSELVSYFKEAVQKYEGIYFNSISEVLFEGESETLVVWVYPKKKSIPYTHLGIAQRKRIAE